MASLQALPENTRFAKQQLKTANARVPLYRLRQKDNTQPNSTNLATSCDRTSGNVFTKGKQELEIVGDNELEHEAQSAQDLETRCP